MRDDRQDHSRLGGSSGIVAGDILRWMFAGGLVLSGYVAGAVGFYRCGQEPARLAGSPAAIMLEFAAQPAAPAVQAVSATIQPEMQAAASLSQPEPETDLKETGAQEKSAQSDFIEKQAPQTQQAPERRHARPERKAERKPRNRPEKNSTTAKRNRKSSAPEVAAQDGKTFAGRMNSRTDGFNGRSDKVWSDLVYRRIQSVARRMRRQLPGARGVAYIFFAYDATGRISAVNIFRSSGDARIDQLALRIVEHSSPLPAPPDAGSKTVPVRVN